MKTPTQSPATSDQAHAKGLHSHNLHRQGYDFSALSAHSPQLAAFIYTNAQGELSINYAEPQAVKALNAALLSYHYGIAQWDIPEGALCPPVPGRIDYLHTLADWLGLAQPSANTARDHTTASPTINLLDIGTGYNGIYALLAAQHFGWHCVATDINAQALANVARILAHNPRAAARIQLRQQTERHQIFAGVIHADETFDLSVCNPPFHSSAEAALKANRRKRVNLGGQATASAPLNFGGTADELWCNGGEKLFLKKMAKESQAFKEQCRWFTSLVSDSDTLKPTEKILKKLGATSIDVLDMHQGNKKTRVLAWRF